MSATKAVTPWCDWHECMAWVDFGTGSTVETRSKASIQDGWGWPWDYNDDGSRQRVDLCPEHYEQWRKGANLPAVTP